MDVPAELAELFRYENIVRTPAGRDLYGVEGKDYILPDVWVSRRIHIDRPAELIQQQKPDLVSPLPITELTSNVAKAGRVLDYNGKTGCTTVVERVSDTEALILTKNRNVPKEQWIRKVVPIRLVKRFDNT